MRSGFQEDPANASVPVEVTALRTDRIGDHTTVIVNRIRFMFTGDAAHPAAEVG